MSHPERSNPVSTYHFADLDSTLVSLDHVLSHYEASEEVCKLIHSGPSQHDIGAFLEALERLKKAQEYFLNNTPQSLELENVTSLLNSGCESLNNHFKFSLKKHCTPLKPVDLLDLIYVEEDTSNDDCPSIKQLPSSAREELQLICNWLDSNIRREYVAIYAAERADVVFRSLSMLKDHQRSGSWGAEPLVSKRGLHSSFKALIVIVSVSSVETRWRVLLEGRATQVDVSPPATNVGVFIIIGPI